jgi:two-component system LytT family sensor kinase
MHAVAAPAPAPERRVPWPLVVLGVALTMTAVDASQVYFNYALLSPHGIPCWDAVLRSAPMWLLWAALTPLAFGFARRVAEDRFWSGWAVPLHLLVGFGFALAHIAVATLLSVWAGWAAEWGYTYEVLFVKSLTSKVAVHLLAYGAIVGTFYARENHRRYRERERATAHLEQRLAEARLQALRTQLQPHFLFNTLNAISVLVLKGETQTAIRMLSRLSDLLRVTLDAGDAPTVPLGKEMEFLARYLDIEQVRFHDRLTVATDVAPDTLDAPVPTLILQPLVENAIRHGIARQVGAGRVEVRAAREGGRLRMEVRDTGPGLPAGGAGAIVEGIGISNTRARLAEMYGDEARMRIENAEGGGLRVVVEMPYRVPPAAAESAAARPALSVAPLRPATAG